MISGSFLSDLQGLSCVLDWKFQSHDVHQLPFPRIHPGRAAQHGLCPPIPPSLVTMDPGPAWLSGAWPWPHVAPPHCNCSALGSCVLLRF